MLQPIVQFISENGVLSLFLGGAIAAVAAVWRDLRKGDKAEGRVESLEREVEQLRADMTAMAVRHREEIDAVNGKLDSMYTENHDLKAQNVELRIKNENLECQNTELRAQNHELRVQNNNLTKWLTQDDDEEGEG